MRQRFIALILVCLFFGLVEDAKTQSADNSRRRAGASRPKIGLVLKGGGALGFAHVGVLKVLERNNIPVDLIAGTSMGSIIGAAYASGASVEEMERVLSETDWEALFGEKVQRQNVDYRLKAGRNREIFGDTKFSFHGGKFKMPRGVVEGQNIRLTFQSLFGNPPTPIDFDTLPIPFRAVTADVETGEVYVPARGDLVAAVRASMSIPGAFSPMEIDGRLLVDGGIANNLPVEVALKMGADILIVVDLQSDLAKKDDLNSPLSISSQMVSLLLAQNSTASRKLVRPHDIVVEPNVNGFTITDFAKGRDLMAIGEKAAESVSKSLRRLSVSGAEYDRYRAQRSDRIQVPTRIDFVRVNNRSSVSDGKITDLVSTKAGDPFEPQKIADDVQRVYQTGYFETVKYSLVTDGEKSGIEVNAKGKDWLSQYVRLGVSLEDDLDGNETFRLGGAFRTDGVGPRDSYLEAQGEIGKTPRFSLELFEPLWAESRYFVAPKISIGRTSLDVYDGTTTIAEYERTEGLGTMAFGRRIGTTGEATLGYTRGFGDLSRHVGDPTLPDKKYDIGDLFASVILDAADKPDFPTSGYLFSLKLNGAVDVLGAPSDFQEIVGNAALPLTSGRNTIILRNDFATTFGARPVERFNSIGGFLGVSGVAQNGLPASNYNTGGAVFFHRFSEVQNPFFDLAFFGGGTYELTTIHTDNANFRDYSLIQSGSVFVGADTPLFPVYLGFGMANIGEHSVYLSIGRIGRASR